MVEVTQTSLFDLPPAPPRFDGATVEVCDTPRLGRQLQGVLNLMSDGVWRTLAEIQIEVGGSEAGISVRLRDLRKKRNGGYTVNRRRTSEGSGLYEYKVTK